MLVQQRSETAKYYDSVRRPNQACAFSIYGRRAGAKHGFQGYQDAVKDRKQTKIIEQVFRDIQFALTNNLIEKQFINVKSIGQIADFILQGGGKGMSFELFINAAQIMTNPNLKIPHSKAMDKIFQNNDKK